MPVSGNLSANESQVLLAAAIEGAGIAMQPAYSARGPIAQGRLVALLPDFVPQGLGVYGVYASRRQLPASLRALLDFLVARFAEPAHLAARRGSVLRPDRAVERAHEVRLRDHAGQPRSASMIGMWWWPPSENSGTSSASGRSALATRTWRVMIWPTTSGLLDITLRRGADEVAQPAADALVVLAGRCWRKKSACVTMPTTRRVRSITGSALMRRCVHQRPGVLQRRAELDRHRVARHDVGAAHVPSRRCQDSHLGLPDQRFAGRRG